MIVSAAGLDSDEITVYLNDSMFRHQRIGGSMPPDWDGRRFPWPFDPLAGELVPGTSTYAALDDRRTELQTVVCRRIQTRWGAFYEGNLTSFETPGIYALETQSGMSVPFEIWERTYDRLLRGYLVSTNAQRSSDEVAGVRDSDYEDDAVRDSDGLQMPAAGGWFDAGDARKWTDSTVIHLGALSMLVKHGPKLLAAAAESELEWGRDYFLHIAAESGQVPDNIAAGSLPPGFDMSTWWFENHSGTALDGSGSVPTDGIPGTGDERRALMDVNAHAQFLFIREHAEAALAGHPVRRARSRVIAERAWRFIEETGHDGRTLFVACEVRAAAALARLVKPSVSLDRVADAARACLALQVRERPAEDDGLFGFFMETERSDGFRSIGFSCEPALALLDAARVLGPDHELYRVCIDGVTSYIDDYLLADAKSNPFGLPPYGIYREPLYEDRQTFRPAGGGLKVRTFIAPWNRDSIAPGGAGVVMHQAYLLARAGRTLERADWSAAAERLLQWVTGSNPQGLSLCTGIGSRHPVAFSTRTLKVPEAMVAGHIGLPDDSPYLATSNAVEWNTQEIWGVSFVYATQAILWLTSADPD
ncbi:MAG TPA: glycoside hydrolase family 9 protein [Acidothermaceae bacterium]